MWRWKTEQSQEVREMERIAVLHYDYQLTRCYLAQWCEKTHQRLGAKANWVGLCQSLLMNDQFLKRF